MSDGDGRRLGTAGTLLLIQAVLVMGQVGLAMMAVAGPFNAGPGNGLPVISLLAAVMLVPCLISRQVIASPRSPAARRSAADPTRLASTYAATRLVAAALLEAPGVFGAVAYMVEHEPAALVAPAVSILMLCVTMPTAAHSRRWAEQAIDAAASQPLRDA